MKCNFICRRSFIGKENKTYNIIKFYCDDVDDVISCYVSDKVYNNYALAKYNDVISNSCIGKSSFINKYGQSVTSYSINN